MKIFLATILVFTAIFIGGCHLPDGGVKSDPNAAPDQNAPPSGELARDLPFGNPSRASSDAKDNYLLVHGSYTLSYNNDRGTLNWIAWRTTRSDLAERRDRSLFEADSTLPNGFRRVQYYDYSGSGYDRGHMVPSADRFADETRNRETFVMTNIVPQARDLNQYPWNKLESYARSFAYKGAETYTIAGVYGNKGTLRGKVVIPTNCWKVIVVLDRNRENITSQTRIIAVDMPNNEGVRNVPWSRYITTVDDIEAKTGLDLFDLLPDDIENAVESKRMVVADR